MDEHVHKTVRGVCRAEAWFLSVCLLALPLASGAASEAGRLAQARELLAAGDAAAALEAYRELQVDDADLEEAVFGTGCALYKQGESHLGLEAAEEAGAAFDEARTAFERLLRSKNARLGADAAFNRANCVAQKAKMIPGREQHAAAVEAYREAVAAYEAVLRGTPDHARAARNLDHVRYQLKLLFQNPPEEQEPPEQPKAFSVFQAANTDIRDADAVVSEEGTAVQLRMIDSEGARP